MSDIMHRLMAVLQDRQRDRPAGSYTTQLLESGLPNIGDKILEEAGELIEAVADEPNDRVVHEAADVLYHVFVALVAREITLEEVEAELARRFGTSGLVERAARE